MKIFLRLKSLLYKSQRVIRGLGYVLSIATVLLIAMGFTGQIIRDRTVEWGLLMYIPLLPLGLWAIFLDLVYIGRSLPKIRFGLTVIGLAVVISSSLNMIGIANPTASLKSQSQISLLHWNVRWGSKNWQSVCQDIYQRYPDIMVMSEPPSTRKLEILLKLLKRTDSRWSLVKPLDTLAIISPWPLHFEGLVKLRKGQGMQAVVTVRDYPLRLLAVDGNRNMSNKWMLFSHALLPRWRTPFLRDVVKTVANHASEGQPIDIIAGDFNALSRSLGFKAFQRVAGGYSLAAQFAEGEWRGTWLSWLPLYDIDHVWIHKRFQNVNTDIFTNFATDHRGQWVHFTLPDTL